MNLTTINCLSKVKNASLVNQEYIKNDCNHFTVRVLRMLYEYGRILNFIITHKEKLTNGTSEANVFLRYNYQKPTFRKLKFKSTPAYQTILSYNQISRIDGKNTFLLFSTSFGLLDLQDCKRLRTGGVLLIKN
jgi:ribosomal protein S8